LISICTPTHLRGNYVFQLSLANVVVININYNTNVVMSDNNICYNLGWLDSQICDVVLIYYIFSILIAYNVVPNFVKKTPYSHLLSPSYTSRFCKLESTNYSYFLHFTIYGCVEGGGSLKSSQVLPRVHAYEHNDLQWRSQDISMVGVLDSERSEECIDFTMIITSRNNAPILNYGVFKKIEKNKKKMTEKREFLRKTNFRPN
ncbi:Uncharacterized protein FWK35_00017546, partial [Aphis craccivora]